MARTGCVDATLPPFRRTWLHSPSRAHQAPHPTASMVTTRGDHRMCRHCVLSSSPMDMAALSLEAPQLMATMCGKDRTCPHLTMSLHLHAPHCRAPRLLHIAGPSSPHAPCHCVPCSYVHCITVPLKTIGVPSHADSMPTHSVSRGAWFGLRLPSDGLSQVAGHAAQCSLSWWRPGLAQAFSWQRRWRR